jgi:hypothetical protein
MYFRGVPPAVATVPKALLIVAVALLQSEKTRRRLAAVWSRRAAT